MKRLLLILALAASLGPLTGAAAQDAEVSADGLHAMCRAGPQGRRSAECLAYIAGVRDSVQMRYAWDRADAIGSTRRLYCLPHGVTAAHVADIVWRYVDRQPRRLGAAVHLVIFALQDRYRCPE